MRIPNIDARNEKDIIRYMKAVSATYTPEWRFDEENPDVGTALAMIYADMFGGSIKKFNQLPKKNKLAFYNEINARLLPAIPAFGYVTFGLAGNPEEGEAVRRGTQLIAEVEQEEQSSTVFETVNDVLVTPAEPTELFCTSGANDFIGHVFGSELESEAEQQPFCLFNLKDKNLQNHIMYFSQTDALNITNGAWIEVLFNPHFQHELPHKVLEALMDKENSIWEYYTGNSWETFGGQKVQNNKLLFFKSERQDAFGKLELFELESFWMRCTVKDFTKLDGLFLDKVEIASMGAGIEPEAVNSNDIDQNIHEFFPFGEKMSAFNEVYIASTDALCKKGANIKISFNLNFIKIPIETDLANTNVNWKLIMKKSEFKYDREYDITIEEVIWEYYNGKGWARLFAAGEYKDVFSTNMGTMGQYRSLTFKCPNDMEPILINACESYYIRAKIIKINNPYKTKGNYISPIIDGMTFSYTYERQGLLPELICTENNLEEKRYQRGELHDKQFFFTPFYSVEGQKASLYFGFELPPIGGPIKILFNLKDTITEKLTRLSWEYYGEKEWSLLNATDETENFRKSGIVTFMGQPDFKKTTLWRKELFWIRVVDVEQRYNDVKRPVQLPYVLSFHMNATQIRNVETGLEELFYIEPQQENFACTLLNFKVQELEVWVNEEKEWIKWQEVVDFTLSEPESRHYIVDRNTGTVLFSNGRNGKIPPSRENESIKIVYSTGGGNIGNLPIGAVNRSNLSIGFVNKINNPVVTFGGCDREAVETATYRNATALKHGYRGVTARDYEALALEATRNICKAKCFAGYSESGEKKPGAVTLILLQKDFINGRDFFVAIEQQVKEYIEERISGYLVDLRQFYVAEPQFLEISVKVELSVKGYNHVFHTEEKVRERLNQFLDPTSGNFNGEGWAIGTLPNSTQVLNCLKEISEIIYIKSVFLSAYIEGKYGRVEADLENTAKKIFALPLSGQHEILISIDEGR